MSEMINKILTSGTNPIVADAAGNKMVINGVRANDTCGVTVIPAGEIDGVDTEYSLSEIDSRLCCGLLVPVNF